jgi:hypothetical protein
MVLMGICCLLLLSVVFSQGLHGHLKTFGSSVFAGLVSDGPLDIRHFKRLETQVSVMTLRIGHASHRIEDGLLDACS